MKILFTNNDKSKMNFYKYGFTKATDNIEVFDCNDAKIKDKAKFLTNDDDMLTVMVDDSLYIEGLPDHMQPGKNYKMPTVFLGEEYENKKVGDKEILEYYSDMVGKLGGMAKAKYIDDVSIYYKGKKVKQFQVENDTILTSKASKVINKGKPLNSITLVPEFGDIMYSECVDDAELLYETRDKKAMKEIAKNLGEIKNYIDDSKNK